MKILKLLFIFTFVSYGQVNELNNLRDVYTIQNDISKIKKDSANVKGSPYIQINYEDVIVNGVKMKGKFNAHKDRIELLKIGIKHTNLLLISKMIKRLEVFLL